MEDGKRELNDKQMELINELVKEQEKEGEEAKAIMWLSLLAMVLGIAGIIIIWHQLNGIVAFGIFLIIWGDNISTNLNTNSKIKKAFLRFRIKESAKKQL